MNNQMAVEWLEKIVKSMIDNGGDLGVDYPALLVHIEKAKELEKERTQNIVLEIDTELARIEDYAHGEAGNDITNLRKQLIKYYK